MVFTGFLKEMEETAKFLRQDQRRWPHNCMSSIQVTYTDNKIVSFLYQWAHIHPVHPLCLGGEPQNRHKVAGSHPVEEGVGSFSEDETQEARSITMFNDKACMP